MSRWIILRALLAVAALGALSASATAQVPFWFDLVQTDVRAYTTTGSSWLVAFDEDSDGGPTASMAEAQAAIDEGDGLVSALAISQESVALNTPGQSVANIAGIGQMSHHLEDTGFNTSWGDTWAYHEAPSFAVWKLESDIYDETDPYQVLVQGEIDLTWDHAGEGSTMFGGSWIVKWEGVAIVSVMLEDNGGTLTVTYAGEEPISYEFPSATGTKTIPFVINSFGEPGLNDELRIDVNAGSNHTSDASGDGISTGSAKLIWTVTAQAFDLTP